MSNESHHESGSGTTASAASLEGIFPRLREFMEKLLSIRNIKSIAIACVIFALLAVSWFVVTQNDTSWEFLSFQSKRNTVHNGAVLLTIGYCIILFCSYLYRSNLAEEIYKNEYENYDKIIKEKGQSIPKFLSVYILPIISIVLVLVTHATMSEHDGQDMTYFLSHTFATSIVLLMIGIELAYAAQEHQREHRWIVLVTVSLVLDFVSYVLLISVKIPGPNGDGMAGDGMAGYVFLLGLLSAVSSYYTVAQARRTDEILASS